MIQITPLHLDDLTPWAGLLAIAFDRKTAEMHQLLHYLHEMHPIIAWGAWDGAQLAAQYSCLLVNLQVPGLLQPIQAGMSVNMAVHPNYRGQGLVKKVSKPVYEEVLRRGGVAGVGFSNAQGVQVDKHSKGYGYQVVGKLQSTAVFLQPSKQQLNTTSHQFYLTSTWPESFNGGFETAKPSKIGFHQPLSLLQHRFVCHPFRHYQFGVWEGQGVVVYRPVRMGPISAVSLLAVYGQDIAGLLRCWAVALGQLGIRWVHLLASPGSSALAALRETAVCVPMPFSRNPFYLTVKPLCLQMPHQLLEYGRWDCIGGDIL